ncbi:MAG: hypothetical protein QOD84_375, partial [Acidobacteriaceae bacterium]
VLGQHFRDGRRQRGLAMINVTNRPNVAVRLVPFKFLFRHFVLLLLSPRLKLGPNKTYFAVPCTLAMISSETDLGASS